MSDSQLLVPMHLDAMVLNQEASVATPFLRFQMEYALLRLFESPEPPPFGGGTEQAPGAGIYLQWTLPDALRHGTEAEDGSTQFPLLPNRWAVVRVQDGVEPDQAVKAWIIESDYTDPTLGTSPFVNPAGPGPSGIVATTKLGKHVRLTAQTVLDDPADPPFLRAVGPGSVTFAAFAPGVDDVLAFVDDVTGLDDATPIDKGTFTYHVAGWYAPEGKDPLTPTTWMASTDPSLNGALVNDTFGWVLYAGGEAPPTTMLVHALVSSVPWDRNGGNTVPDSYPENVPSTVKVAFGSTAIDALAAIVRLEGGTDAAAEADLLEAFQYGLLERYDQPGSAELLAMDIRQHWYAASPGGTLWSVVAAERTGSTALPAPPPPVLNDAQLQALAALNVAQRELDRQTRILQSMQWTLFSLWWKTQWQNHNTPPVDSDFAVWLSQQLPLQVGEGATCNDPGGTDPSAEQWYLCKVQAQQNLATQLQTTADEAQAALQALLDPTTTVIKPVTLPQFWAANDPVMVATGLGRSTAMDPVENLVCRLVGQTVQALTVSGTSYCAAGICDVQIAAKIPVLTAPDGLLPSGVQALHVESFFLSPELFAQDVLGDPTQADAVRAAIAALPAPGTAASFPPAAGAMGEWVQPWVPLLLDWEVTVFKGPAYTDGSGAVSDFHPELWTFDGTDFQWNGPTQSQGDDFNETQSQQMQLSGRTFITPQLSLTLASQLEEWITKHRVRDPSLQALLEELEAYLQSIRAQDILSQRLSGMMQMMVGRDVTQSVPPFGDVAGVLGDSLHGIPNPFPSQVNLPVWDYAPMAGTFFVVNRLSVIDVQGRTVDLTLANYSTDPLNGDTPTEDYFYPIAGRGVYTPIATPPAPGQGASTDPTQRMMQLEPRPVQDARLSFALTTADGANQQVGLTAGGSPVCGWIVPNHLDRSLALYAPDGTAWGELYLSLHEDGYVPVWQQDPTNPSAPAAVDDIPNQYVRDMLGALVARTDNGAGFWDFFRAIDETLWTITPRSGSTDADLSVLVGRPLAVVRAEVALQLRGVAYTSQDWWNTFDVDPDNPPDPTQPAPLGAVDGAVTQPLWQVRVGSAALPQDGVIGYYLDVPGNDAQTWATFNSVVLPAGSTSDYVRQIAPGNFLQLRFADDTVDAPDPAQNQVARLTLLVDPSGSMHAFSGLLPVTETQLPAVYVTPPLEKISYLFRAGPFLTSPDEVRIPRPAETHGTWAWFDHVLNATTALTAADGKVRFPATPPLAKEGWLKFTPNPELDGD